MRPRRGMSKEERVEQLKGEVRVVGFAVVKEIARIMEMEAGEMECPLCGSVLRFSIAGSNGHLRATCTREGCISGME